MAKVGDVVKSAYLKPEDLQGQERAVTIKNVTIENKFGEDKFVLHFGEKQWTLGNKNLRRIVHFLESDESDDWIGARIHIRPDVENISGEMKKVIVISGGTPRAKQQPAAGGFGAPATAFAAPQASSDDIPF